VESGYKNYAIINSLQGVIENNKYAEKIVINYVVFMFAGIKLAMNVQILSRVKN
jgi:hypothetical protein